MGLRNQKGQTMVEYLLLLVVSVGLVVTFINSDFFKKTFGAEGQLAKKIKLEYEFGYRHAYLSVNEDEAYLPRELTEILSHPSYYNNGNTRFFGPMDIYPE